MKKLISLAIICYNEEENILPCYRALEQVTKKLSDYIFEYIFVDNGSTDESRIKLRYITQKDSRVTGVFLSRNFGPEASTQAGLDHCKGDAVILYEGDMQDPPEVIPKFIRQWERGYDAVVGIRTKTQDSQPMAFLRSLFYKIMRRITDIYIPPNAGHYSLLSKKVVNAINKLPEKYRFFRGLRSWVGFKTAYVTYERKKRARGKSSYTFLGYLSHAERSFFGFSYLQLNAIVYTGLVLVTLSFITLLVLLLLFLMYNIPLNESTIIFIIIIFFGGVQLLAISIIGKYIQVIVEETKGRPVYIVEEVINKSKARL